MTTYAHLIDREAPEPTDAVIPLRIAAARLRLSAAARIDGARADLADAVSDYNESSRMFLYALGQALPRTEGQQVPRDHHANACTRMFGESHITENATELGEARELLARQVGGRGGYPREGLLAAAEATPALAEASS